MGTAEFKHVCCFQDLPARFQAEALRVRVPAPAHAPALTEKESIALTAVL